MHKKYWIIGLLLLLVAGVVFFVVTRKSDKQDLVVYNFKSNKYHESGCEWGAKCTSSCKTIDRRELPQGARPCGVCSKKRDYKSSTDSIELKPYNQTVQITDINDSNIKMFFIDSNNYIKPSKITRTTVGKILLSEIKNAKNTIDFAIYGIAGQPEIFNALIRAQERGVRVRWVTDYNENSFNIYPDTRPLAEKLTNVRFDGHFVETIDMPYKQMVEYEIYEQKIKAEFSNEEMSRFNELIMHNKFFIFDGKKVFTGSTNISSSGTGGYNTNVAILINSPKIANIYQQEFNQMYEEGRFHKMKIDIKGKEGIKLGDGSVVSIYFSPDSKIIKNVLFPLISNAEKSIYIPIFFLTHKRLPTLLIDAHERGVEVKVIVDASSAGMHYSKHKILRMAGIPVKVENKGGKMHMKTVIIDDEWLFLGSMNLTSKGQYHNDENTLVINNPNLNQEYKKFFLNFWNSIDDKWLTKTPSAESPDSENSCSDGLDNDHDGYIDKLDNKCKYLEMAH